jgi:coenzyme Q-binding protein COQ10
VTAHSETRILPYTADLMYAVVADVEKYPEFLPWVVALRVLRREVVRDRDVIFAEMAVGYGALRERYTSRVVLDPKDRRIDVVQTEGPFKILENHWHFTPSETGSVVEFSIVFQFKNRLLNAVASAALEKVMFRMADAFEARAKALSNHPVQ